MKKTILAALVSMMLLSSCSKTFYQVYTTKAPGMIENENYMVYENNDCKLMYNLWAEDGNAGFIFENKTNANIFIILPQTFFIKNGMAFDYFKNREYSNTQHSSYSTGKSLSATVNGEIGIRGSWFSKWNWYDGSITANVDERVSKGSSATIINKESPIICVPPHSYKMINEYSISSLLIRQCNRKQAYPKTRSLPLEYTKETSPLVFKNIVAYSFDSKGEMIKHIENEFWISELINYSEKEAVEGYTHKECEQDLGVKVRKFINAAPNKFYLPYRGNASADKFTNGL